MAFSVQSEVLNPICLWTAKSAVPTACSVHVVLLCVAIIRAATPASSLFISLESWHTCTIELVLNALDGTKSC